MANVDEERGRRIEALVLRVSRITDQNSREAAQELMEAILEFHGAGLERMLEIVLDSGEQGKAAIRRFGGDSLVASLLILHGLHPDDLETRVHHALGKIQGAAELLGVFDGVVRVRLASNVHGLKESIEAALLDAVPDAAQIVIEDAISPGGFVPLSTLWQAAPVHKEA